MSIYKKLVKELEKLRAYQPLSRKRKIAYISIIAYNYLDANMTVSGIRSGLAVVGDELNFLVRELYYINPPYVVYYKIILSLIIVSILYLMAKKHYRYEGFFVWVSLLIPMFGVFSWIDLTKVIG